MTADRAKTKVLRMSQFCMIEMTRQRVRPSLKRSIYMDCPHCHGSALIKTPESVSLDVMRRLAAGATRMDVSRLDVKAYPTVATFLLNRKRKALWSWKRSPASGSASWRMRRWRVTRS